MPDQGASIVLADAPAIERLCAESGLRAGVLGIFQSKSVLETVGGREGVGFDELLRSRRLVACDRRLLSTVPSDSPDAETLHRYRANFVAKLARRRVILLVVLGGEQGDGESGLHACQRDVELLVAADPHCRCEIVLVAAADLSTMEVEAIKHLQSMPAVSRIYVMTKWLQPGRGRRHIALSDHVWPLCVGRLLAMRAVAEPPLPYAGVPAPILAWRTFAWGTLASDTEMPAWESEYLHTLRELLVPPLDAAAIERDQGEVFPEEAASAAARPIDLPPMHWADTATQLRKAGDAATGVSLLHELVKKTCQNVAARSRLGAGKLRRQIQSAWAGVASNDGITRLRRIRDGHCHQPAPVEEFSREQRARWFRWRTIWAALERCRTRHGAALDALALARSRHLPLAWHLIIGAMILPFVFQFIAGVLLPLRPEGSFDESPLFSAPSKAQSSIAYLVDRSSSMDGIRLDRMKDDLKAAIEGLPDGTRFTVAAFNEGVEELPIAAGALIEATTVSRKAAIDWVDGIRASGLTTAVPGLRRLVTLKPDLLVFLTDGLLTDTERTEIDAMLSDRDFLGDTRFDTVMLFPNGEEPAMKAMAEATDGRFRRVTFDPFAPLGFNRVLAIAFCATLAGVLLGAIQPWLLERRAGIAATAVLRQRLQKLLANFGKFSEDTAVTLEWADAIGDARRANSAWDYQGTLAARALGQLEASLANSPQLRGPLGIGRHIKRELDPLHAEDVRDFHDALDEPLPLFRPSDYQRAFFQSIAATHAREVNELWSAVAAEQDVFCAGHLPICVIAERFGDLIGRFLMEASRRFLLPHGRASEAGGRDREPYYELFRNLAMRIADEPHRPFLSARIKALPGAMPHRFFEWVGTEWADSTWDIDAVAFDFFRQKTGIRFVTQKAVNELGLLALGLIHDEVEVNLNEGPDGTAEFVYGGAV